MSFALTLLQQAPSPEQVKYLIHPILRHGRDNISYLYSLDAFDWTIVILYFTILTLLAILGVYRVRMVYQFWRYRHIKPIPKRRFSESELPRITVQLPLFNEMYVAERLLDSVTRLDYPRHLLEIQVLDDSTDETNKIAEAAVEKHKRQGFDIQYIHREDRTGFKAGALENGMRMAKGQFVAIFDADFLPKPDCLRQMVDFFTDERIGMVQMRWSHINANYSLLTQIQEVLLDGISSSSKRRAIERARSSISTAPPA